MGEKRAYKPRRPGGGRRKSKPEYDAGMSLQAIADELGLNPIKVRKLLITAGVYFPGTAPTDKISVGAERQRRYRAMKRCRDEWDAIT